MTKVFCPHCGNKTLKKVAVSVSDDGSLHMHFSRNPKVLNPRGLRVSSCTSRAGRLLPGQGPGLWPVGWREPLAGGNQSEAVIDLQTFHLTPRLSGFVCSALL